MPGTESSSASDQPTQNSASSASSRQTPFPNIPQEPGEYSYSALSLQKDQQVYTLNSSWPLLLSCGEQVAYCADWMKHSDFKNNELLSSQRISELLQNITGEERQRFFKVWSAYRSDRKFLALDITSISS